MRLSSCLLFFQIEIGHLSHFIDHTILFINNDRNNKGGRGNNSKCPHTRTSLLAAKLPSGVVFLRKKKTKSNAGFIRVKKRVHMQLPSSIEAL